MTIEPWQLWLLIAVTINTIINLISNNNNSNMLKRIIIPESLIDAYNSHLNLEKVLVTRIFCIMSMLLVASTIFLDRWALPSAVYES